MRESGLQPRSRRSVRLPGYDYRQAGVYFVTLCAYRQACLFGAIIDGEMTLNELGKIVSAEWQHISTVRREVKLDQFVVMPNHLHGLVIIEDYHRCELIQGTSGTSFRRARALQSGSLGAIVGQYKLAVIRQVKRREWNLIHQEIWQRNYHEHIVRNEESLNEIRRYIIENPAKWAEDSLYLG